jgi:hypothetical protein
MHDKTDFETRLRVIEDRLEILNLLAGAAFSSDVASETYQRSLYAEDVQMDLGPAKRAQGREEVVGFIKRPGHIEAIRGGLAHFAGVPRIDIEGDRAVATGYLLIIIPDPTREDVVLSDHGAAKTLLIWRMTVNRWELARTVEGWQVARRVIRPMADGEASALIRGGIEAAT